MQPDKPILMITLQIPLNSDTSVDLLLEAIGQQVGQALQVIRQQQEEAGEGLDPEAIPEEDFALSVLDEKGESFSDTTRPDLLAALGYAPED